MKQSDRWQRLRKLVLCRDGYQCRFCGSFAGNVYQISPSHKWMPAGIVSVCRRCLAMCRMGLIGHIRYRRSVKRAIWNSRILRLMYGILVAGFLITSMFFWMIHPVCGIGMILVASKVLVDLRDIS